MLQTAKECTDSGLVEISREGFNALVRLEAPSLKVRRAEVSRHSDGHSWETWLALLATDDDVVPCTAHATRDEAIEALIAAAHRLSGRDQHAQIKIDETDAESIRHTLELELSNYVEWRATSTRTDRGEQAGIAIEETVVRVRFHPLAETLPLHIDGEEARGEMVDWQADPLLDTALGAERYLYVDYRIGGGEG